MGGLTGSADQWPLVATQLPVFNELNGVERLIDTVVVFDYPKDWYEIQELDDTTDETRRIVAARVRRLKRNGIDIHHIHRVDRTVY